MNPKKMPPRHGPEYHIRADIIKMLHARGWIVKIMGASEFLDGVPDLYCTHKTHGPRWIEVKLPNMRGSRWTNAQLKWFPLFGNNGTKIYILTAATEGEYRKLFNPDDNWLEYFMLK